MLCSSSLVAFAAEEMISFSCGGRNKLELVAVITLSEHICVRRGSLKKPSNTKSPRLIPLYTESQWCEALSAAEMQENSRVS